MHMSADRQLSVLLETYQYLRVSCDTIRHRPPLVVVGGLG